MADSLFACYQRLKLFPLVRPEGNLPSKPGVFGSINYRLVAGSRPTYCHLQQHRRMSSSYSSSYSTVLCTPLQTPQVKCRRQDTSMARRSFLLLLFMFLFQPPACKATPPVFDVDVIIRVLFIPSETKPGTPIYRLKARDQQSEADYPITFSVSGTGRTYFRIESVGEYEANLVLQSALSRGRSYSITITATDTAREAISTDMRIEATGAKASPSLVFTKYPDAPIIVPENARTGMVLARLEARKNSNSNRYPQVSISGSTKFKISGPELLGRDMAKYELQLSETLDYEDQSSYLINITATEGYRDIERDNRNIVVLPLTVMVKDIQDTAPVFSQLPLLTKIPADKKVGEVVFTVKATDGDKNKPSNINYRILGDGSRFFRVDSDGKVTVAAPLNELLVNCQDSPMEMEIRAEEVGTGIRPSTTSQVVVLIQNPAVSTVAFTSDTYRATVNENAPVFTFLTFETAPQVTSQAGCGIIQLDLRTISGQLAASSIFEIKPNVIFKSGAFQIWVKDPAQLDYEQVNQIRFEVTALNLRMPQSTVSRAAVILTINDLNDNPPVFTEERYHVRIPENALENTIVAQVTANDADNGKFGTVRYTDVRSDGPLSGNLRINRETGQVILTTSNHGLDREKQARHIITVEAQDNEGSGGNTKTTEIQVDLQDVNDNPPMFSRSHFYFCLSDSLRNGEVFWNARATDADEPNTGNSMIQYDMVTRHDLFQMTAQGSMSLTRDASGISGSQDTDLIIRARDMGNPVQQSQATVHISWDKRTCQKRVVEYLVDEYASTVQSKRAQMERMLTDLNGGSLTKIDSTSDLEGSTAGRNLERLVSGGSSAPNNVARTKIMATVLQHGNNSVVDLTALARFNHGEPPAEVEAVERAEAGVSDAWKWVLIALLILLALVLLLLLCCCLCKPTRKKTSNGNSQRSQQVVEVATIGGNRQRHHHHHHHRQPPPGERTNSAPSDRRGANGRGPAGYSRHMQEESQRSRKSLDGTEGDELMVDPATGKKYRVRFENGRRILVRSGEGEQHNKKVTRGTNVTENVLQPETVETANTPPMTVIEGDDDQKQLLKNQFLEKKSLFTIAYDGMHSKHDLLKDSDDSLPPNVS